ncbi:hypothetical protein QJS10_CPB13g01119 [Acorus calamus]|uniref:Reverse transcriptase n=1 Tax=Acorus calamus TaxID=4465 RepID=A0AAV9DI83_ACOCL|nr:hypothetical protein QJS10_CPB13g01119 [Acorus calamus]
MNSIIWNVRGLNSKVKQLDVKQIIRKEKCPMFCLLDTKMDANDQRLFCSRSFPSNAYFTTPDGRIALFWEKDILDTIVIGFSAQHIHCLVQPKSLPRQSPYYCTYVYASNSYSDRISLWSTLVSISTAIFGMSWCVGVDFNEVRFGLEKVGGRPIHSRRVRKFNNCLLLCSLEDIKSTGHTLSWSNQQENRIACRLDRILANPQFFAEFSHALIHYLPPGPSDHALLKLKTRPLIPTGPRPFRYFEMWEEHPQFSYVVDAAWKQSFDGSPLFQFVKKLSNVKYALKCWNKSTFGGVQSNLSHCREKLESAQSTLHGDPINPNLIMEESIARQGYMVALRAEESFLRQKLRQQWLALGDKNSKFFYSSIKVRSSRNSISCLRGTDGMYCTNPDEIKSSIIQYYKNLLNPESGCPVPVLALSNVSQNQNATLVNSVTLEEVKQAVFGLKSLSAPGPDGFPARFYQLFWPLVQHDLFRAVKHFFEHGHLLKQISHSYISLIPKSASVDTLDGYRPISLCNTLYKVITKILATRL